MDVAFSEGHGAAQVDKSCLNLEAELCTALVSTAQGIMLWMHVSCMATSRNAGQLTNIHGLLRLQGD